MKKTLKLVGIASLVTAAFSFNTQADINPWQECGIGAMIFPDNGTASAISNIIWDLGTTAVTSASASEDSCKGASIVAAQFINDTYNELEEDIVKGNGAHLTAMMSMMSCSDSTAIRSELGKELANDAFNSSDTTVKAQKLFNIAQSACSAS
jgi:hypothetical protein